MNNGSINSLLETSIIGNCKSLWLRTSTYTQDFVIHRRLQQNLLFCSVYSS